MIYSLRTFRQTGIQEDETIGRRFQTIHKEANLDEFQWHLDNTIGKDFKEDFDNMYALLYSQEVCIPLYKTHRYYVVMDNGNTYANITFKK